MCLFMIKCSVYRDCFVLLSKLHCIQMIRIIHYSVTRQIAQSHFFLSDHYPVGYGFQDHSTIYLDKWTTVKVYLL